MVGHHTLAGSLSNTRIQTTNAMYCSLVSLSHERILMLPDIVVKQSSDNNIGQSCKSLALKLVRGYQQPSEDP